jgi:hypothetical protein
MPARIIRDENNRPVVVFEPAAHRISGRPQRVNRPQSLFQEVRTLEREFILGLDLGQANDFTALAVVERLSTGYAVPLLTRTRGKPYPEIVQRVTSLLTQEPFAGCSKLVLDATGVGRPVLDLFRSADLSPLAVTITGGDKVSGNLTHAVRVPKRDLVKALLLAMQAGSLTIAQDQEHARTLARELAEMRVKISNAGHDSYGVWRDGEHDDLVLALALAVWCAERTPSRLKPNLKPGALSGGQRP